MCTHVSVLQIVQHNPTVQKQQALKIAHVNNVRRPTAQCES